MAANPSSGYRDRAEVCDYSVEGGTYAAGETLTVELSCQSGGQIYYTLDCSAPTRMSTPYTGPITISDTTILRTIVYADDSLPHSWTARAISSGWITRWRLCPS